MRALIIDDEERSRFALRTLLKNHDQIEIVGEAGGAGEGQRLIRTLKPDVIFLDIEMPEFDGFELLEALDHRPQIVFVTAHSEHAIHAFEVDATDYLLKPISAKRLAQAVVKILAGKEPSDSADIAANEPLYIRAIDGLQRFEFEDIVTVHAQGDFARVKRRFSKETLVLEPLKFLESLLPSPPFYRLDRSLLMNLSLIQNIQDLDRNSAFVRFIGEDNGLEIGRSAKARLKRLLKP